MARVRFGRPISLRWNGLLLEGPANTVFEIPDEFYEEFNQDIGTVEPTIVWLDTDEASTLRGRVTALEGAGSTTLSSDAALALGTAAAGVGTEASRDDHVHPTTGLSLSGHNHTGTYATTTHSHAESDVTNLVSDLADKVSKTIVDAKGDLIVGTAADTVSRLAVSATNGYVLSADSTAATGLAWVAQTGGGGGGGGGGGHSLGTAIPLDLGTAAAGTSTHGSREDHVHSTNGVSLTSHNHTGTYDAAGTAASAVSTHEAASDPHPGYLTPTEGNAAYSATGHAHSGVYDPAGTTSTHAALTTTVHGITDTANLVYTSDARLTDSRTPSSTLAHASTHLSGGTDALSGISPSQITGTAVITSDSRLSDARTPSSTLAHASTHAAAGSDPLSGISPSQVTGTAVITSDSRLSDARTPTTHTHAQTDVTSLTTDLADKISKTIVDAKGDIIVATASDTVSRLAVGATNGHVLTVDSAEATGLKWAAASGGSQSLTLNQQTGTTYTLVAGDLNKLVEVSNTGAITVTVPANILAVGDQIHIMQTNTGQITVAAGANVAAVNSALGLKLRARWSSATLIKRVTSTNADQWVLVGDCEA